MSASNGAMKGTSTIQAASRENPANYVDVFTFGPFVFHSDLTYNGGSIYLTEDPQEKTIAELFAP